MGPLQGVRIVKFAGLGPAPFGAMMLADLGADIIRIDRPGGYPAPDPALDFEQFGKFAFYNRHRRTVRLDLKAAKGCEAALRLITHADALIEGFRPGVMEKLGLGPAECLAVNPRLLYAGATDRGTRLRFVENGLSETAPTPRRADRAWSPGRVSQKRE